MKLSVDRLDCRKSIDISITDSVQFSRHSWQPCPAVISPRVKMVTTDIDIRATETRKLNHSIDSSHVGRNGYKRFKLYKRSKEDRKWWVKLPQFISSLEEDRFLASYSFLRMVLLLLVGGLVNTFFFAYCGLSIGFFGNLTTAIDWRLFLLWVIFYPSKSTIRLLRD